MANILGTRFLVRSGIMLMAIMLIGSMAYATHLRAGNIIATRDNCNSRLFHITIIVYTNTNGTSVLFGGTKFDEGDLLDFGDGKERVLVPEIGPGKTPFGSNFSSTYEVVDADRGIAKATYTITHEYTGSSSFKISYREPNRNEGVLNMDQSVNTPFYLETVVVIDPFLGCDNTPNLLVPPIDRACLGVTWSHNPGAYDPDGDSLSYAFVVPNQEVDEPVLNYRDPNKAEFYADFEHGSEDQSHQPTFKIDPISGTITWDAPGKVGQYNIAFVIKEWRKYHGKWQEMGFVRRDMQIIVEDCDNDRPDLEVPKDICVIAESSPVSIEIFGTDPDNNKVKIEAFSEIFNYPNAQSPATRTPYPAIFQSLDPVTHKAKLTFTWQTKCLHVKDQPYLVVFKITDQAAGNNASLATYKSWFIKVVGPKPVWKPPVMVNKHAAKLEWENYECQQNAETMQVWRRVGEFPFSPDSCQTGMPKFLGYKLIATVPIKTGNTFVTTYTDTNEGKGLAPGAKYCYRLVAEFPLPRGGESLVSEEICLDPIPVDVPVITNVSVEKTDRASGEIRVRWRSPFENSVTADHYVVSRAIGFARGTDSLIVNSSGVFINDTTFIDKGLNTEENVYNYTITARDLNDVDLGTSAAASAVRLETKSQVGKIELKWDAFVPWSNQIIDHPTHELYRGLEGTPVENFALIGNVDVIANGFTYLDEGLLDNQVYCYRVRTFGGYDNKKIIDSVLVNFSQVICAQTGDSIPPCKLLPPLRSTLDFIDCNDYRSRVDTQCDRTTFSNTIYWSKPEDEECRSDVSGYNVYAASRVGDDFIMVSENQKDTFYVDKRSLLSYAQCYRIAAVDRSGNEGELSDILCIDNCPYYELPNVFTPNGDNINDEFSAYNAREYQNCGEVNCIPIEVAEKCARFVISVKARIYNRWGKEVYSYEGQISDEVKNIYIDWNGLDSNGRELAPAVYYYIAEVTFDTVDPAKKVKTFKGWIHMIR
ncbi:MAG: gliding motility-associated C-terminal domain-containing protein [Chryseolinea sp.]